MVALTEEYLDGLDKKLDRALDMIHAGDGGVSGGVHFGDGSASFFEVTGQQGMAKARHGVPYYRNAPLTMPKSYKRAEFDGFGDFVRSGFRDQSRFAKVHGAAVESLAKSFGQNTADFTDGGALVLPEFSKEILTMLYESPSLWARTRQYTVKGNSMKFPRLLDRNRADGLRHGGARGYWVGEGDPITSSKLQFGSTDINLVKLGVVVYLTDEMLEDSGYVIEQFVTEAVRAEIDYMLDKALLRGDGVNKPLGIFNSPVTVTISEESGQSSDTLVTDNVLKMWARRMPAQAGDDLVWIINQDIEPQLLKLNMAVGTAGGQVVYMPPNGLADRPYATLMGRPVIPSEHCSTLGDVGDIALVNFAHYLSANKGVVNQVSSPHVEFLRDVNCLKFTFRINGRPFHDEPLTLEQSADKRSPFVVIETR